MASILSGPQCIKWGKAMQRFQRYAFHKVWTQFVAKFMARGLAHMEQMSKWANDHDGAQLQA